MERHCGHLWIKRALVLCARLSIDWQDALEWDQESGTFKKVLDSEGKPKRESASARIKRAEHSTNMDPGLFARMIKNLVRAEHLRQRRTMGVGMGHASKRDHGHLAIMQANVYTDEQIADMERGKHVERNARKAGKFRSKKTGAELAAARATAISIRDFKKSARRAGRKLQRDEPLTKDLRKVVDYVKAIQAQKKGHQGVTYENLGAASAVGVVGK